jgi:hypothetical protein
MLNLIRNNPRTFHTAIAVAATIAALVSTTGSCRAAELKWRLDETGKEHGLICATTQWGIRDGQGALVGTLAPGECMKLLNYAKGSGFVVVEGGKSGRIRILRLDPPTSKKLDSFWYSCSDQAIELQN